MALFRKKVNGFETYGGPSNVEKARGFFSAAGKNISAGAKATGRALQAAEASRQKVARSKGFKKFQSYAQNLDAKHRANEAAGGGIFFSVPQKKKSSKNDMFDHSDLFNF